MKHLMLFAVFCLVHSSNSLSLPSTFQRCDKRKSNFNDCLSSAIQNAVSQLSKPIKEYSLPSFEPFLIPAVTLNAGINVSMDQKFTNLRISGRTNITSTKAIMNFDDLTLTIRMVNPEIRYLADYQVKGNMFLLPIDASGLLTTKGYNILYTLIFKFEEYTKNGARYLKVISSKIAIEPESMTYYLENLFEDKELNDAYSRAVSKRSKEIFGLQQLVYGDSYAQSYNDVFNNLLRKVPLTELFEGV